jgi:hypothetical protein
MTDIYKNFHTETIEGFEVRLRFVDENISPEDMFDCDIYGQQDIQAVYNGDVTWLCAIVEVFKCGVELAYTTLGAITYEWHKLEDFIKEGFYDMADEAIAEAKAKLAELRLTA